jgi:hypothetical protein
MRLGFGFGFLDWRSSTCWVLHSYVQCFKWITDRLYIAGLDVFLANNSHTLLSFSSGLEVSYAFFGVFVDEYPRLEVRGRCLAD